jgi:transcriptional regulator with XRE-family HTH domain
MNLLGKRIAERRKQMGLSQEELAHRLKTNQKQVSRYENAQNDPTVNVLLAIAEALHTTPAWLLGFDDDPESPDLSADERELIERYRSKDREHQEKLLEIAKIL